MDAKTELSCDITGFVLAFDKAGQPVMAGCDGQDFVLVCSTKEKLIACLAHLNITEDLVMKWITNPWEFLDSIPVPVMLDPYVTPDGHTRFQMVFKERTSSGEGKNESEYDA